MTALAIGASVTAAVRDGGIVAISTNGGLGSAVVTTTEGATATVTLGPAPERRILGPYAEGASVVLSNANCNAFDYDAETKSGTPFDPASVAITGGTIAGADVRYETIGQKMRRLLATARVSNPIINRPLTPSPAWAASTAYIKGQVVSNGGNLYVAILGGTSAASGGPTGTSGYITDNTVRWYFAGIVEVTSSSILAPTITYAATNVNLVGNPWGPSSITLNGNFGNGKPNVYGFFGGVPGPSVASAAVSTYWTNNGSNFGWAIMRGSSIDTAGTRNGPIGAKVEFFTDAEQITMSLQSASDAGSVLIDDTYVRLGTAATGGSLPVTNLDFTAAGGRKPRRITVELPSTAGLFTAAAGGPRSTFWAPPASDVIRAIWVGDSIWAGSAYHAAYQAGDIPSQVGKLLGWRDTWNMSIGGTGWITNGTAINFLQRIPLDVTPWTPDVVVLQSSQNDSGQTPSAITAQMLSGLRQVRAAYPYVPIIVVGAWPSNGGPNATIIGVENAAASAVSQMGDSRIFFIPVSTDVNGPWIFGTGYTGATNNTGNTDILVAVDNTHPTQLGCDLMARMLAAKIANVIAQIN